MHIQVEESVHAAARILNGENVADIPIQESAKGYFIDWNAMQKEHLTIADIPHEYTIINIPFKTRHPIVWWFALLGSITAIVSLLSGITYLYWRETKGNAPSCTNWKMRKNRWRWQSREAIHTHGG